MKAGETYFHEVVSSLLRKRETMSNIFVFFGSVTVLIKIRWALKRGDNGLVASLVKLLFH